MSDKYRQLFEKLAVNGGDQFDVNLEMNAVVELKSNITPLYPEVQVPKYYSIRLPINRLEAATILTVLNSPAFNFDYNIRGRRIILEIPADWQIIAGKGRFFAIHISKGENRIDIFDKVGQTFWNIHTEA